MASGYAQPAALPSDPASQAEIYHLLLARLLQRPEDIAAHEHVCYAFQQSNPPPEGISWHELTEIGQSGAALQTLLWKVLHGQHPVCLLPPTNLILRWRDTHPRAFAKQFQLSNRIQAPRYPSQALPQGLSAEQSHVTEVVLWRLMLGELPIRFLLTAHWTELIHQLMPFVAQVDASDVTIALSYVVQLLERASLSVSSCCCFFLIFLFQSQSFSAVAASAPVNNNQNTEALGGVETGGVDISKLLPTPPMDADVKLSLSLKKQNSRWSIMYNAVVHALCMLILRYSCVIRNTQRVIISAVTTTY